jgi:hypothetical protein
MVSNYVIHIIFKDKTADKLTSKGVMNTTPQDPLHELLLST